MTVERCAGLLPRLNPSPRASVREQQKLGETTVPTRSLTDPHSVLDDERKEYRRLYLASFGLFLIVAIVARLLPPHWRQRGGRRSIVAEARETAHSTLAFAFMQ